MQRFLILAVPEFSPVFCQNVGDNCPLSPVGPTPKSQPIDTALKRQLMHVIVPLTLLSVMSPRFPAHKLIPLIAQETLNSVSLKNTSSAAGDTKKKVVVCFLFY